MRNTTAHLLTFGAGGHTLYGVCDDGNSCQQQGYSNPEGFCTPYHWWAHPKDQMSRHTDGYTFPAEGIPVIDKCEAVETDAGFKFAINGPMVDVRLKSGEVDRCPEPNPLMAAAMVGDSGNEFGALLVKQKASRLTNKKYGPLDSVDVATYIELWRNHGARIGTLHVTATGECITWE